MFRGTDMDVVIFPFTAPAILSKVCGYHSPDFLTKKKKKKNENLWDRAEPSVLSVKNSEWQTPSSCHSNTDQCWLVTRERWPVVTSGDQWWLVTGDQGVWPVVTTGNIPVFDVETDAARPSCSVCRNWSIIIFISRLCFKAPLVHKGQITLTML